MHVSVPSTHKNELNVSFFVMPAHLYQQNPSPCRVPPTQVPSCPPEQPSSQPAPQTCLQEEGLNLRKQHELLCVKKKEEKTLLELRASDSMYSAPAKLKKKKKKKKSQGSMTQKVLALLNTSKYLPLTQGKGRGTGWDPGSPLSLPNILSYQKA